ncbi:MAG: uroporphyrinogen decarboxylase family protein, partial [Acidobacteriota bacterium]
LRIRIQIAMTSKERMRLAMERAVPDRVPVMCQMSIGHMLLQTGLSPAAFWNSAELFAAGLVALREAYRFDGILVSLHGHRPDWEKQVARVEKEDGAEAIVWKDGGKTVYPRDDLPIHRPAYERPPPTLVDFDPEALPEEIIFIPVSQGLDFDLDRSHMYEAVDLVVERVGAGFSVHAEVTSPFDYYLRQFGYTQALIGLLEEPQKAKEVLQRFTDGLTKLAAGLAGRRVDAVKVSSPYAGAGFISPRFYREFVLPFEAQIARAVRSSGVPAYVHTCGAIHDRLEMMAEAGFSGIECLDPPPLGNVELAEAKRRVGDRVFIKGNVDPVNVLLQGGAEKIRKDAEARLAAGKPGGGYILSTACSIAPRTPRENVEVLSEVAEAQGSY